ncbi:DUF760 domain-containing protein [Nodosilinea nodulosa]|uniref:DUF760 domain-containing protein n=1 Tax=Nodosilinea nodulosa TaxID=416001 RepID=UPI0003173E89|nr:DUF760 domain-containing protein [Nodosilinea nodulosa]
MSNSSGKAQDLFNGFKNNSEQVNSLMQYVHSMSPETISQLSNPASTEVQQMMEHNIIGLLGGLPSQHFDVEITTNRESLGRLLASAMMSGYFLRGAEQRMAFEHSLMSADSSFEVE